MYRKLFTAILLGFFSYLGAQPKASILPIKNSGAVTIPSELDLLPNLINSSFDESAPLISTDGNVLYFTRQEHPQNFGPDKAGDIWVSRRKAGGNWSRPVNAGAPLNNIYHNTAVALDPSGQIIYLQNTYDTDGKGPAKAIREGRSWSNPEVCAIEDFYSIDEEATFHICADGNTLIIGLERLDGQGKRDLYVSFSQDGNTWSAPLNLGPTINTSKQEARAFLAADGRTLYFASEGHGGRGGLDLYYSQRLDDSWTRWSEPKNLGAGINTRFHDEHISLPATGDPAYLVYRDSGSLNIYTAHLPTDMRPEAVTLVRGKVKLPSIDSGKRLQATSLDLQKATVRRHLPLGDDGSFVLVVPSGKELGVQVEAPGYFPVSTYFQGQGPAESAETDTGPLLASTSFSPDYFQRDSEIKDLKLRLDQVDEELAEIRKQRAAYLYDLRLKGPSVNRALYSDPELEALQHRYQELNRPVIIDTVPPPESYDWQAKGSQIPEKDAKRGNPDDELADMKKRFKSFYRSEGKQKEKQQQEFLWEEAKGFADFQEEIHRQLRQEMKPQVGREVAAELWPQVKTSMQESLQPELMEILDEKEYEIREQIVQRLEEATIQVGQSKIEMPGWQQELEGELRTKMEAGIRRALTRELQDDVRSAMTNEAFYQVRTYEANFLKDELNKKVRQQVQEEEQQLREVAATDRSISVKGVNSSKGIYREEERELILLSPEKGTSFTLNNVFFKPNTDQLKEISYLELDRVVSFLVEHPDLNVEIAAHTNGWLSHSLSLQLSEQRAETVADYLFNHGVSALQVEFKGYGKTSPIASNDTLEGRRKNQRIELHILEN